ncbi:hypothetical protein [Glaciibacter flavus]|uniref:hypothetical protein n=1 Tax=Orlajensenia flava TaxID=2565934 RepID=UPI003B00AED1
MTARTASIAAPTALGVRASWPALAALGAGLVHLAVAASAPVVLTVVLVALGIAEIGWALTVLRAGRVMAVRSTLAVAASSSAVWVAIAFTLGATGIADPADSVPLLPLAAATLFTFYIAVEMARVTRSGKTATAATGTGGRLIVGLVIGAAIVAAVATPALAATDAGKLAHPHGEHGFVAPGHQH